MTVNVSASSVGLGRPPPMRVCLVLLMLGLWMVAGFPGVPWANAVPVSADAASSVSTTPPSTTSSLVATAGHVELMSRPPSAANTVETTAAAADTSDAAARRTARVAPLVWRHIAAAKNAQFTPKWNLPPTTTSTTPRPDGRPRPRAPTFGRVPPVVDVWPGHTVILSCVVHDLGDRMVSWIRSSDLQILTAGPHVFTSDSRISVDFEAAAATYDENAVDDGDDDGDDDDDGDADIENGGKGRAAAPVSTKSSWPLTIRQVRDSDVGLYECQINTEPKLKTNVTLMLHEPQLADLPFAGVTIDGVRDVVVAAGTNIRLVCRSPPAPPVQHQQPLEHPQQQPPDDIAAGAAGPLVTWLLDGRPLSGGGGEGGISEDNGGGGGGAAEVEDDHSSGFGEVPSTSRRRVPPAVGRAAGGVNVLTELSPTGIVSALTLAAATESDGGAYECRVRDVGADAVHVQVVRKGGGGGGDDGGGGEVAAASGIIVRPWILSDQPKSRSTQSGGWPDKMFRRFCGWTVAFQRLLWQLIFFAILRRLILSK